MKKIIQTILYTSLFLLSGIIFSNQADAQQGCAVTSAKFSEITGNTFDNNFTNLEILTNNCDDGISIDLYAITDTLEHQYFTIEDMPGIFHPEDGTGKVHIKLKLAEGTCYGNNKDGSSGAGNWGYDCVTYISVNNNGTEVFIGNSPELTPEYVSVSGNEPSLRDRGVLVGNCYGICNNEFDIWEYDELFNGEVPDVGLCVITKNDISFSNVGNLIKDANPILEIKTQNCNGVPLNIAMWEQDTVWDDRIVVDIGNKSVKNILAIPVQPIIKFSFTSTELSCDSSGDPTNCLIYVEVKYGGNTISTEEFLDDQSNNLVKGVIFADCVDIALNDCSPAQGNDNWTLKNTSGIRDTANVNPNINILNLELPPDPNNPCWRQEMNNGKGGYDQDCYETLAPIPGIGTEFVNPDGEGTGRYFISFSEYELGRYINTLFQVALGILMVLAVIMIVVAGVEYMTVESIYGKGNAKGKITSAITGLILALGIFIILDTINPKLLEINFGKDIATARIGIVDDPGQQDSSIPPGTVTSAPTTNICANRKDRGYWPGQNSLKLQAIAQTTQTVNLQDLEGSISVKPGNPQGTNIKYHVEETFAGKLIAFKNSLQNHNIQIEATETFGPTILGHGSPCHYLSSCIDLATQNRQYPIDTVEKIIRAADSNGLTAHFEFSKNESIQDYQTMQNELFSRGIDKCMVLYVRHATAWHFSIYDKANESLTL